MSGMEVGTIWVVLVIWQALFIFGIFYNRYIEQLGTRGEGWVWLQVVAGVFVTQAGAGALDLVLDWNALLLGMLAYSASGLPMIWGAYKRYQAAQLRAWQAAHEQEAPDD